MKERLKQLRKALGLTQAEFARRIGMKQSTIAQIEIGRPTSDRTLMMICQQYGVNLGWLKEGEGDMFASPERDTLGQLCQEYGLSGRERVILERFVELPPDMRRVIIDFVRAIAEDLAKADEVEPERGELEILQERLATQYEQEKRRVEESAASGP